MTLDFNVISKSLRAYLEIYPQEAAELTLLTAQLQDHDNGLVSRKHMRGHLCASGLVFNAAQDHVLFIHQQASDFWMQPGGHYENEKTLWDTACREVREETGLSDLRPHPWHKSNLIPFDIHTHPIAARPEKNEGEHFHHDFCYAMIATQTETTPQAGEIKGTRWIALSNLPDYPGLRLRDRFLPKIKLILGRT